MDSPYKISLVASANRPEWWIRFMNSLKGNTIPIEVVFVGNVKPTFDLSHYPNLKYIYATVKPAQCYEIAFRNATGELLAWTADDADYNARELNAPNSLDIAYEAWTNLDSKFGNDKKSIIAMNPCEDGGFPQLKFHRLFGGWEETPTMAPFAVINRDYFVNKLGGYDRRFISGQSENDVIMRIYEDGGRLEISLDAKLFVRHTQVHYRDPNTGKQKNDFRKWYPEDRRVLEEAWIVGGYGFYEQLNQHRNNSPETRKAVVANISKKRLIPLERFEDTDICTVTQSQKGQWE